MNESQIEDGLRNIALLEPGLGFDPDEVAVRAAKRQKTRSMALVAGVATAIIGLTTAGMVVVSGKDEAVPPAVQETSTPLERNKRHFAEVAPARIAGIRDFAVLDTERPYYVNNPEGSLLMAAGFQDRNGQGKANLGISDKALAAGLRYPTPEQCFPGSAVTHYDSCRLVTQLDGSTVIAASSDAPIGTSMGVVAIHHRKDGTYVVVTIATGVLKPGNGEPKPPSVAEDEAIALATDPAFSLR